LIAVDGESLAAIYREVELEEPDANHQDLRLRAGLDPNDHFTEKKQSTVLDAGASLVVEDITTSNVERFDTLARAHRVLATLSNDAKLAEFSFILDWPKLSDDQKRAKYSEFACHELSFFLSKKDRAFFTSVIQPYLRHKKDKTFMDHYLLEDDLADYLEPWNYGRLNILERILLAQRISGESGPTARHVRERFELIPPDIEVTIADGRGRGPAAARNTGWRAARHDWIAFLDDDVLPDPDWLDRLGTDLIEADEDTGGVQGRLRVPLPPDRRSPVTTSTLSNRSISCTTEWTHLPR